MNVKIENVEKNVVQLEIEVDEEKFQEGMQKSFIKNMKRFTIPGFRRGKAPRSIVERYYGEQVLYEDAINYICPEAYEKALTEYDIHPVDEPEIDIKQIGKGQNLVFTAKVTTKPEVELGEYKGIEVEKVEINITDKDVEEELKKVQDKNARLIAVEDRGIQNGDTVLIDFEGFIDGNAFEGGKATDFMLTVGEGKFIPGFEEQLIGVEKGVETDINVTFPENYHKAELAGKPALFKVKVKEIKVKELPALDDEFAKDVSEFDTLEAYKEDLRKKLVENAEHKAKHETEDRVIDKVAENASVDIPRVMIEKRIDSMAQDFELMLYYQGIDLKTFLELGNMDINAFRKQFEDKAQKEVKNQLVIEKIAKVEAIEATEEEFEAEVGRYAENRGQNVEEFKKHLKQSDIEYIKKSILVKKTIDFLVKNAKLV